MLKCPQCKSALDEFKNKFVCSKEDCEYCVKKDKLYGELSKSHLKSGRYDEAFNYCCTALEIDPHNAEHYYNRGNVLYTTGNCEDAVKDYDTASLIDPGFVWVHGNKAAALFELNRLEEALSSCVAALKIDGTCADIIKIRDVIVRHMNERVKNHTGIGQIFHMEGSVRYKGELVVGKCHGSGTEYYVDSKVKYQGEYKDDTYCGYGKIYSETGGHLRYEGQFKDGKFDGRGTYYYINGKVKYSGEFKENLYHGSGVLCYPDGSVKHKGIFINGKAIE